MPTAAALISSLSTALLSTEPEIASLSHGAEILELCYLLTPGACVNIQSVSTQEAQGRESGHVGQSPASPPQLPSGSVAASVPGFVTTITGIRGPLDTFGIDFLRPNALQIKFPERETAELPRATSYRASKGAPMCACIVLPDERQREGVVQCPLPPADDISRWGSWCFLDSLGRAWNRMNFTIGFRGGVPPSLNSVFEELPWRPVESRGAEERLWSCQMRTRLPK